MSIDDQQLPGLGINRDHYFYSNFFNDNNIIQQTAVTHPKNLLIDTLRHYFSKDNLYTYRSDEYGFPLVVNMEGKDLDSTESTKILISDVYRYEVKFFPAIIVKCSGGSYRPISFNQNGTIKYRTDEVVDNMGFKRYVKVPSHRVYSGAWEINFEIAIYTESQKETEELADMVSLMMQYSMWHELRSSGLFIKNLSIGGESAEQYANDYIYSQNVTLGTRSEWRVEIPIDNLIEKMVFRFESTKTPNNLNKDTSSKVNLKFKDLIDMTSIE